MSDASFPWVGRGLLLDIEGTTSAVAYVYDVMFPFARKALGGYLDANWTEPVLDSVKEQVAQDSGAATFAEWAANADPRKTFQGEIIRLMDGDLKATGLKQLQGLIWESGFRSGELRAHVYPDVPPTLQAWRDADRDVRIYSSGSIHAQKLFFAHTEAGDLTPHFSGHYDTTTGPKREAESYRAIARDWNLPADEILFLSDVAAELDAARSAGMATLLAKRPGNAPVVQGERPHREISTFEAIELV